MIDEAFPVGKPEPEPVADVRPPTFALPRTVYVYLALFLLTYFLPPILRKTVPALAHRHHATAEAELSEKDFDQYLSAEGTTRNAIYYSHSRFMNLGAASSKAAGTVVNRRKKDFSEAIGDYRALSLMTHAPNMDRRVLILNHLVGNAFDESTVTRLTDNLRLEKASAAEIAGEIALWRQLYGSPAPTPRPTDAAVTQSEQRIRAMHLRFLQDLALADLYHASNKPSQEAAAEKRLEAAARSTFLANAVQVIALLCAGLAGLGLLIYFGVAAGTKQWPLVRRRATAPLRLGWGDLMDGFLFYLAVYRVLGLLVSLTLAITDWEPGVHQMLLVEAGLQIATGLMAAFYVAQKATRRETTLADLGLTTRGNLIGNIGYGIAGYCATLPLMLAAGGIAHLIFRHSTNTTPNPVLPLMVGTHDPLSRGLIFLMASIAAPLFEEFFFRGVLFTGLRIRYGWVASAAISGLCFALVHPMQDWLPIFAMGFTFATMREMRQSLVPSMTAHFLQNTLAFLMITNLFS